MKLTDLKAHGRVGRDGRDHPHCTVRRRRCRRTLVRQGRWRRPVDIAVVGLTVDAGGRAGLPVTATSLVEAISEAGQAGAQRSEAVL